MTRYGFVPLMLLGAGGAVVALAGAGVPKVLLLLPVLAALALSFAAERTAPYLDDWNDDHDDRSRDVAHALVNETLIIAGVALIPLLAALVPGLGWWPSGLPFAVQVLVAVLAADLGITLTHLASHKVGWLWRMHAVHHSVSRFYGLNGLMKHPLHQSLETAAGVLPLVVVGMPVDVASALGALVAIQLMLQHSNVDYRVGPLRTVLALNEGHRFHHLRWAGVGDVNFGLFTLLWDHALGTFSFDPARRFSSADLGMAAKPHYPTAYAAQLAEPFRAGGACGFSSSAGPGTPR